MADHQSGAHAIEGVGCLSWIAHAPDKLLPSRPVCRDQNTTTLYAGLPLAKDGVSDFHDAENLRGGLHECAAKASGAFILVRADERRREFEIANDFLGFCQLYTASQDGNRLYSTSVAALAELVPATEIDPLAASEFCSIGWVAADRTLHPEVKVCPGGLHVVVRQSGEIEERQRFSIGSLESQGRRRISEPSYATVATALKNTVASSSRAGTLYCPITAGKDSRLMVALCLEAGASARYFTTQSETSPDVILGRQIAERFGLDYELQETLPGDISERFSPLLDQLSRQTDGMRAIDAIRYLAAQPATPDKISILLNGHGGEICRVFYGVTRSMSPFASVDSIVGSLASSVLNKRRAMLLPEGEAHIRGYLQRCAGQWLDGGFSKHDIPDLFYLWERVRRWAGTHRRAFESAYSVVAPMVCEEYATETYRLSAQKRFTEPMHYQLLKRLSPELHGLPFEKDSWRPQNPELHLASRFYQRFRAKRESARDPQTGAFATVHDWLNDFHLQLLERHLPTVRSLSLDQASSPLWNYVSRPAFERLTRPDTPRTSLAKNAVALHLVNSVHWYRQNQVLEERGMPT